MGPLHYLRLFSASGNDAGDFLHGQLTADILNLAPRQATIAAWCSPRGQVLAPLLVQRRETDWLLALEQSLAGDTINRFSRFIMRAQVRIAELQNLWLAGMTEAPAGGTGDACAWLDELQLGYTVTSKSPPSSTAESTRWKQRELRRGLCWLSRTTTERFLPQMLGLDDVGAVSFSKGCYPGQEIVARARYLGKIKRRPVILDLEGKAELQPGDGCQLSDAGIALEGIVLDSACPDADVTTVMLVAAVPEGNRSEAEGTKPGTHVEEMRRMNIDSLTVAGRSWPARAIDRATR